MKRPDLVARRYEKYGWRLLEIIRNDKYVRIECLSCGKVVERYISENQYCKCERDRKENIGINEYVCNKCEREHAVCDKCMEADGEICVCESKEVWRKSYAGKNLCLHCWDKLKQLVPINEEFYSD